MSDTLHGEYKVPGGKLVVADVRVEHGHLQMVRISGDFFLEPPEALQIIDQALTGLAAASSEEALAAAIAAALPDTVEMFGFSPVAVAIAVRRSLS
jgi:hypothetical protein